MSFLAASAGPLPESAGTGGLRVEIHARRVVPGEVLRVVVRAASALDRVRGTFRGRDLAFAPIDDYPAASAWAAWAVVGLTEEAGVAQVEIEARCGERILHASRRLTIGEAGFPLERLEVAPRHVNPPAEALLRIKREKARLARIYRRRRPLPWPTRPFLRPVAGAPTSRFGLRRVFNGVPRAPHSGLDLRADVGTPVRAASSGTVVVAGEFYYSGKLVILDHGMGLFTLYAHLSRIDVTEGDWIERGRRLGLSGATGRVTGPHLHWGAKIGDRPFDPRALLDPALFGGSSDRRGSWHGLPGEDREMEKTGGKEMGAWGSGEQACQGK
ncbi:MAG: M23 family metallopeptidase [Acidobacteriota bacterium]|nr:M23 family metallopeptidase [Acidobacteriota bacterium]